MASVPRKWIHGVIPLLLLVGPIVLLWATAFGHQYQNTHRGITWWMNCQRQDLEVFSGDYLLKVFKRNDLEAKDAYALLQLDDVVKDSLTHLRVGLVLQVCRQGRRLKTLAFPIDREHQLLITKRKGSWRHWLESMHPKREDTQIRHFTVRKSFYHEAREIGLSIAMIHKIERVFRDKIKFSRDIQKGDHFDVIVRHLPHQEGPILVAVKYNHRGKTLAVMRYRNHLGKVGFYTKSGHSVLQSFDRVPLHYKRVSSRFRRKRRHPLLGYVRPHFGVDLAAPRGTPIYSTSSGKVGFVGAKRGYGKTVVIQHGNRYKTIYAHMSRFAKRLRNGSKVKRHQLIGYVGMTGLATGPHCHYEFRINNRPYDPMRVRLPGFPPLRGKDKKQFAKQWYFLEQKFVHV